MADSQQTAHYQHNALGQITRISQWDYDPAGRIAQHLVTNGQSKQPIIQRHYQYDPAGNLQQLHDAHKGSTHYHYNALNQLTAVDGYINEQFAFDPAGNITQDQPASSGNRLAFYGDKHYQYDSRGNLIEERRRKHQQLITRYCYNTQNQLIAVEKNGQQFTYRYDALGRRISKKDAFGETHFLWNGDVLLSETRKHHQKLYIYEPNSFKPLAHIENNQCYFYHLDHLGTPQEITDWAGHIVWSGKYKAYGNLALKPVEEVENNLRFQGQYYDEETGLHYNRHRYYDPGIGQFISQDPIGLIGGENSYQYAANPTGWVDPFGLTCKEGDGLQAARSDVTKGLADPSTIRFTQDSVKRTFGKGKNGPSLQGLIDDLKSGKVTANDIPAIRIFQKDGQTFSLDNRRLKAFQEAGVPIRTRPATTQEIANDAFKLTSKNGGISVKVRGGGL